MSDDQPPIPPTEDKEGILTVDDIDFTQHDEVEKLGNGRYLVKTDGPATPDKKALAEQASTSSAPEKEDLEDVSAVYAVHGSLIAGEEREELTITSDDVVEAFDELVVQYAKTTSGDIPVEDALALLARESEHL